ncbi:hypothetical protein GE191_26345 [Serratia fonticola]|nr:hypothetical protein [Serratia fonticola]
MNSAFIKDGSIMNAKIGQYIQSDNYDWDAQKGWAINKDGNAVFNSVTVRGHMEAWSGYFSGELRAYNGYFGGEIRGANGYFTGTVHAENIIGDNVHIGVWKGFRLYGVNDETARYFTGGLPYDSVLVIPYANLVLAGTGGGEIYVKANGLNLSLTPQAAIR